MTIESGGAFKNVDAELDIGEPPSLVHSAASAISAASMDSAVYGTRRVGMVCLSVVETIILCVLLCQQSLVVLRIRWNDEIGLRIFQLLVKITWQHSQIPDSPCSIPVTTDRNKFDSFDCFSIFSCFWHESSSSNE
jgi:hypothetical protein